jgi:hypothetical protein
MLGYVLLVVIVVGICMYVVKPTNESFRRYLEEYIRNDIRNDAPNTFDEKTIRIMAKFFNYIMRCEIRDYIVLKLAYIKDVDRSSCFIGIFRRWYELSARKQ